MTIVMSILICLQVMIIKGTIDMNEEEFKYIANHLTPRECRRLFTALQFTTYDLTAIVSAAEKTVPQDATCIELLLQWNSGLEKWEGKDKTHVDVEHRLRQLGRTDLANWLGRTVFHKLAKNVFDALEHSFIEDYEEVIKKKSYEDGHNPISDEWTDLDYILWFLLIGLVLTALFTFGNIIIIKYKKRSTEEKINEEEIDILSHLSIDSDQDTVYNFKCFTSKEEYIDRCKEEIH